MVLKHLLPLVVLALVAPCASPAVAPAAPAAPPACDLATADRLVEQQHLGNAGFMPQPVAQVLCGPFTGRGSTAMVVNLALPSCGFSGGWVVYRLAQGRWRRVFTMNGGAMLAASGSRIRSWQGVLRGKDPHCAPSSYRSRYWHWNGKRLVAGPWHRSGPPPKPLPGLSPLGLNEFVSPDHKVWCQISGPGAGGTFCGSANFAHAGFVTIAGVASVCNDPRGCLPNFDADKPVLAAGLVTEVDGFRCMSTPTSITCVVATGAAAGRGFSVSNDDAKTVAG